MRKCNKMNLFGSTLKTILIAIFPLLALINYLDSPNEGSEAYGNFTSNLILKSNETSYKSYITYAFVHTDFPHLYGNIMTTLIVGFLIKKEFGYSFWLIFLSGVYGGSICLVTFKNFTSLAGCSGGTYGVIGALFIFYINKKDQLIVRIFIIICLTSAITLQLCTTEQTQNQYIPLLFDSEYCQFSFVISNSGVVHLGGFAFGILATLLIKLAKRLYRLHFICILIDSYIMYATHSQSANVNVPV